MGRILSPFAYVAVLAAIAVARLPTTAVADEPATKSETKSEAKKAELPSPLTWPVGKVVFQQSEECKKIREILLQPTEFQYLDTPLGDVVSDLEMRHKLNIELDMEALAADGKGSDLPITKTLKDVTLESGLRLILEGQGLTYLIKNDVLLLTTKTAASAPENLSTRLYQVHDLVVAPNDPTALKPDFDSLIELLTNTIRQQDWMDNGGTIGFIHSFRGPGILALVATHDEQGHREIEQLLKMLRESRLPQIVEAQERQPLDTSKPFHGMGGGNGNSISTPPTTVPAAGVRPSPGFGPGF